MKYLLKDCQKAFLLLLLLLIAAIYKSVILLIKLIVTEMCWSLLLR